MTAVVGDLVKQIKKGSRSALAKAITLVESTRQDHRVLAEDMLTQLLPKSGKSIRIAISGPPGVGKSSFIEAFGLHLTGQGKKVAVLAIDPSSPVTGGSILGDKTRMEELSKSESCFIRPSPSSGVLGGVTRHTREAILLCEAAGFDVIIVETVGIGQSEIMAASMTDVFVQLHQPLSGDELQGIKKGVMELADLVLVTKADGDLLSASELAKGDLVRALSLTRTDAEFTPEVLSCSSIKNIGIREVWIAIEKLTTTRMKSGFFESKRLGQVQKWLHQEIADELQFLLESHPKYQDTLHETTERVERSGEHCGRAARNLVQFLLTATPVNKAP